jgi:uncharacterized delta-60 repeat protein
MARYTAAGVLDTTFSGDGKVVTNLGGIDQGLGIAVQVDGKIVVAGQKCIPPAGVICDTAVERYKTNGAFDTGFSGDGRVLTDFGGDDNGSFGAVALQSNGKIVVAGYMFNTAANNYEFAVYRYNANGALDTTFSGDGMVSIGFGAKRQDLATAVAVQSNGRIVIAGSTCDLNNANCNFAVARLNPGGTLDTTFSGDGRQTTNFGANESGASVALQPDGKILLAGHKATGLDLADRNIALVRYTANGSLDTTFNGTGKVVTAFAPGVGSRASDILVQSDGKIVVSGAASTNQHDFALLRYLPNGKLDTTFSGDGKLAIDFGNYDEAHELAVQADGKYVLVGESQPAYDWTARNYAVARVLP